MQALAVLVVLLFAIVAVALFGAFTSVNHIRSDFCAYLAMHDTAARELPQVPARVRVEAQDLALESKLGC